MLQIVEVHAARAFGEVYGGNHAEGERVDWCTAGVPLCASLTLALSKRAAQDRLKQVELLVVVQCDSFSLLRLVASIGDCICPLLAK